jgi:hypothetical protein
MKRAARGQTCIAVGSLGPGVRSSGSLNDRVRPPVVRARTARGPLLPDSARLTTGDPPSPAATAWAIRRGSRLASSLLSVTAR